MADDTADDGYVLSTDPKDIYYGDTLQDAVANTNALQLLAWTAGNEDMILDIGANVTAAQVAFARAGSLVNSLNLGQFAMENRELITSSGGDMVAALSSYITARRVEISIDKANGVDGKIQTITGSIEYYSLGRSMAEIAGNNDKYLLTNVILLPHNNPNYSTEFNAAIDNFRVKKDAFLSERESLLASGDTVGVEIGRAHV